MKTLALMVGALGVNCYIYYDEATREAAVIDPGDDAAAIMREIAARRLEVRYIINTHGHCDHIGANRELKAAYDAPLLIHGDDAPLLTDPQRNLSAFIGAPVLSDPADRFLKDGDTIAIGGETLTVLHTPGHTPGGICLLAGDTLFSGDTLFAGSVGRTDFPGGSMAQLVGSVRERLMVLPDDVQVYPGHGEATTIGTERRQNPFI